VRIGIDARELQGRATGVGRYLRNLLRAWPDHRDELMLYFRGSAPPDPVLARWGMTPRPVGTRHDRGLVWQESALPAAARHDAVDVFFAPAYFCPLRLDVPRVTVIHDMSFYAVPHDFTPWDALRRRWLVRWSALASRRIVTVSDFSRRQIAGYLPAVADRIRTIPHAADTDLPPGPPRDEARRSLQVRGPLLLSVGSILNRRHLPVLLSAIRDLVRQWPELLLDVVGENRTHPPLDLAGLVDSMGLGRHVRLSGFIDDTALAQRYSAADAVVYLSEYEGFGLPVLEALSRGLPVLTTRRPATGEVFAEAALLAEPDDPREIADQVRRLLMDPATRATLSQHGRVLASSFSWEKAAAETRRVLEEAAAS
jgi:glycosyltransferase involved in cell wall biosynthesis